MGTIIVGLIFTVLLIWAGRKAFADMKKGKCSGCSSCGPGKKPNGCHVDDFQQ